ncbi:unnamed protein product [Calypogeia fissa]
MQFDVKNADPLDVYDPVKDEWRVLEPVGKPKEKMLVAGGKFYSMSPVDIHVYDFQAHSWAHLHSFSFAGIVPVDTFELWPVAVIMHNYDLLALMDWPSANRNCVVQSRGLGSQSKELEWLEIELEIEIPIGNYHADPVPWCVRTIQL